MPDGRSWTRLPREAQPPPVAIAGELTRALSICAAALSTVEATSFYVYSLLHFAVGVFACSQGPRRIRTAGAAIAAAITTEYYVNA